MIIWGLDLRNIHYSAFKSSNMFDKRYYLRPERFVIYQLAMVLTVVSECLATYSLDRYLQIQKDIEAFQPGSSYYNNDIVGCAGLSIFAGVFTATVFGTMFFFNLFWPALPESKLWSRIKYAGSIFATLCVFAAALASTIVVATRSAYLIPAPGQSESLSSLYSHPKPPFKYSSYAFNIGWIVLMWIGLVFTALSTYYVFKAARFHLANPHHVNTYPGQTNEISSKEPSVEPKPTV